MILRSGDAITNGVFRQCVKRNERVLADIVEHSFEPLVEEWEKLLHALAANARADAVIEHVAHRAVRLREASAEL